MNIISGIAKDEVVVLGGHAFKRVKNGLDEAEVASFIGELLKERDKLAQTQEHIASLNRLAERAIVEADRLAAQIKAEATQQAEAESVAIVDKAKEQARQIVEEKVAAAMKAAKEQAEAIKVKAQEEAATLLEDERTRIRNELRHLVDEQVGHLLDELERLKQQATAVQADFHVRLAQPAADESSVAVGIEQTEQGQADQVFEESSAIVAEEVRKTLAEALKPGQSHSESGDKSSEVWEPLEAEGQPEIGKPQWQVEIVPPFEIGKIMEVVSFLDQLPEVANTEMIVPQVDSPLILVFLSKPMNVIDVLHKIPAVAHVEEIKDDQAGDNGRPKRARISLTAHNLP